MTFRVLPVFYDPSRSIKIKLPFKVFIPMNSAIDILSAFPYFLTQLFVDAYSFVPAKKKRNLNAALLEEHCPAIRRINLCPGENDEDKIFTIYLNTTFSSRWRPRDSVRAWLGADDIFHR